MFVVAQRPDHLGTGEQPLGDRDALAGGERMRFQTVVGLIGFVPVERRGPISAVEPLALRRDDGRHPIFVGNADPTASRTEFFRLCPLILEVIVLHILGRVVGDTHKPFVQQRIGLVVRYAVAHHQRIGIKDNLGRRLVRHAVADGKHVLVVDFDLAREDQTLSVVPGECHRMARGQHRSAGQRPWRLIVRQCDLGVGRRPTELGEIGKIGAGRSQEIDLGALGIGGLVIALEFQVVETRAFQQERTVHGRCLDGNARTAEF